MEYQALYRRFRPQTFSDMVGQQAVVRTLRNQVQTGRVAHAYLFCGSRGTGKTSAAKILSRAVNCLNPKDGDPCGECEACRNILSGASLDVVEVDAASNSRVEEMREMHLDVPQMTALAGSLRAEGMPLKPGILTVEELAEEVERLCPLKSST